MQVVYAPATLHEPSLFLGGSISGTGNWQQEFIKELNTKMNDGPVPYTTDITIYNPRREDFDIQDDRMSFEQINWEHRHLRVADILIFWFAKDTVAPITLFELGRHSMFAGRDIYIGCDPEYSRIKDVEMQMTMINLRGRIRQSTSELVDDVCGWLSAHETAINYGGSRKYQDERISPA